MTELNKILTPIFTHYFGPNIWSYKGFIGQTHRFSASAHAQNIITANNNISQIIRDINSVVSSYYGGRYGCHIVPSCERDLNFDICMMISSDILSEDMMVDEPSYMTDMECDN